MGPFNYLYTVPFLPATLCLPQPFSEAVRWLENRWHLNKSRLILNVPFLCVDYGLFQKEDLFSSSSVFLYLLVVGLEPEFTSTCDLMGTKEPQTLGTLGGGSTVLGDVPAVSAAPLGALAPVISPVTGVVTLSKLQMKKNAYFKIWHMVENHCSLSLDFCLPTALCHQLYCVSPLRFLGL